MRDELRLGSSIYGLGTKIESLFKGEFYNMYIVQTFVNIIFIQDFN